MIIHCCSHRKNNVHAVDRAASNTSVGRIFVRRFWRIEIFSVLSSLVGERVVIGLERSGGDVSRFELTIYPEGHADFDSNYQYVERIVKFLLWQRGGHTLYVGGSPKIAEYLKKTYNSDGAQKFDYHFMGRTSVYEREFSVVSCDADEVPASRETGKLLGRNLQGHRIGFDLGASDRKVSAVVDGTPIFSEEVTWEPRKNSDPQYHYREIMTALKTAASKLPRVDAIGGSSAGIYIDNRPMVASLCSRNPAGTI
jgi:hypothetical protein